MFDVLCLIVSDKLLPWQLWTLYCDQTKSPGESSTHAASIVMEFWGKVTPGILHLLTQAKEVRNWGTSIYTFSVFTVEGRYIELIDTVEPRPFDGLSNGIPLYDEQILLNWSKSSSESMKADRLFSSLPLRLSRPHSPTTVLYSSSDDRTRRYWYSWV